MAREEFGGGGGRAWLRPLLALAGLVVLGSAFAYDYAVLAPTDTLLGYDVGRLDWLWLACLWVNVPYVVVPVLRNREGVRRFVRRLREQPVALAAVCYVVAFLLVGTVGPLVVAQPSPSFEYSNQPPAFTSVPEDRVVSCHNPSGDRCHGTLRYPLGTDNAGKNVLRKVVLASRVEVQFVVVAMTLVVPLATLTGTAAAYAGGRVDRAITAVIETVQTVPALLVFLTWRWITGTAGVFELVVVFGLANWGTVAAVVRSRARDEMAADYVRAARAAGAGPVTVVREHLLPNVSRTAVSAAVYQLPLLITVEATLSFLKFGFPPSFLLLTLPTQESWGRMIGRNIEAVQPLWWRVAAPVAALLLTVFALSVVADSLQDYLDPHAEG